MKKIISIIIIGIMMTILIACGDNKSKIGAIIDNGHNIDEISIGEVEYSEAYKKKYSKEEKIEDKYKPIVTIEELPINIKILDPDSIGKRYMEATYENNSKYTIKGLSATVILNNKNEKTYLSIYDAVPKGRKSPKFETFAPDSGKTEDYEIVAYEITVEKDRDTTIHIIYDVKTKEYNWF